MTIKQRSTSTSPSSRFGPSSSQNPPLPPFSKGHPSPLLLLCYYYYYYDTNSLTRLDSTDLLDLTSLTYLTYLTYAHGSSPPYFQSSFFLAIICYCLPLLPASCLPTDLTSLLTLSHSRSAIPSALPHHPLPRSTSYPLLASAHHFRSALSLTHSTFCSAVKIPSPLFLTQIP